MSQELTAIDNFTVGELINKLKQFPQDLPVLVSGYESGFENLLEPEKIKLIYKPENKYWDGEFQKAEQNDDNILAAVVLQRQLRSLD